MKSVGIREAKARISELARAAAKGEATILTDYGKPVAMVGPLEQTTVEETGSDAGEFRCGFSLTGRSRKRRCARPFASEVRQRLYD